MGIISDIENKVEARLKKWGFDWLQRETGIDLHDKPQTSTTQNPSSDQGGSGGGAQAQGGGTQTQKTTTNGQTDNSQGDKKPEDSKKPEDDDSILDPTGRDNSLGSILMRAIKKLFKAIADFLGLTALFNLVTGGNDSGGSDNKNTSGNSNTNNNSQPSLLQRLENKVSDVWHDTTHSIKQTAYGWIAPPVVESAVFAAADKHHIDRKALLNIAHLESGYNSQATNGFADGLFQFVKRTAAGMGLHNAFDPMEASDKAAMLWNQTHEYLKGAFGGAREISNADVYLGHMFGMKGSEIVA